MVATPRRGQITGETVINDCAEKSFLKGTVTLTYVNKLCITCWAYYYNGSKKITYYSKRSVGICE